MTLAPADVRAAKATLAQHRKAVRKSRPPRVIPTDERQRVAIERDKPYLAWIRTLPCVACLLGFEPPRRRHSVEAAHQRHVDGKGATFGKRVSDFYCTPLCSWHHRLAPNCCDPVQVKFWKALNLFDHLPQFCSDLRQSYTNGKDGAIVVREYAELARRA